MGRLVPHGVPFLLVVSLRGVPTGLVLPSSSLFAIFSAAPLNISGALEVLEFCDVAPRAAYDLVRARRSSFESLGDVSVP